MSKPPPKNIGSCRIDELLGQGGMAEVYAGFQENLGRKVAVKALLREKKDDDEATERFRREALALASLQHEHILAVHDMLIKYNRQYIIMEFVDGVDLADLIKQGPLPLDVALIVGEALAAALEHAHFRKVLHRDIKPGNVMLSRTGQVKLADFGIAKDQTLDDLTRKGFVVGTPRYLSPEQAMGGKADWRSDLYSLGVLLFEALSGKRAFRGKDPGELLLAVARGEHAKLRQVMPGLPRAVEKIVHRCMQVDPTKRYQRASELRADLARLRSAVLRGNPAARIVRFLRERGQMDQADLTLLASEEVEAAEPVSKPATVLSRMRLEVSVAPPSRAWRILRPLLFLLLILGLLAGSLGALWLFAPERVQAWMTELSAWLQHISDAVPG